MKRSWIIFLVLLMTASFAGAQSQITRSELLKLYYEANVAANNNNDSVAVQRFLTIIKHVPSMSDPYLRIAEIYDKPGADRESVESAIFMYRHFVDIELDEEKSKQARARLCELEKSLEIPLFVEYSEKKEYQPDDVDAIPSSDEDIQALLAMEDEEPEEDAVDEYKAETAENSAQEEKSGKIEISLVAENAADENAKEDVKTEIKEDANNASKELAQVETQTKAEEIAKDVAQIDKPKDEQPVQTPVAPAKNTNIPFFNVEKSRFGDCHTFVNRCDNVEIVAGNTQKKSLEKKPMTVDDICGRWVSASKLYNGREVWIIDVSCVQNALKVSLNRTSGIYQMATNRDALTLNAEQLNSYYSFFQILGNLDECRGNDISSQTMALSKDFKDYIVDAELKDSVLSFGFTINKSYKPNAEGYDMTRSGVSKCSEMLTTLIGSNPLVSFFASLISTGINVVQKYDKAYDVEGNINFSLSMTERGLVGTCKELVAHISSEGVRKEQSNNVVQCSFYKVPDTYYGATMSESVKSELQENAEERILADIKQIYKNDKAKRYFLEGIAKSYNVGKATASRWNPVSGLKSFVKAADEGNLASLKIVTATYYALSRNTEYSNSKRRKYLSLAQSYGERLSAIAPASYNNILASHYIACDVLNGYGKAVSLLKEAADRYNSDEARCSLAQLYLMDGGNAELKMALDELTLAVENGYSPAMVILAKYYKELNQTESYIALIDMALKKEDYNALPMLSLAYMQGVGVSQNYMESVSIYDEYLTILYNEWRTILGSYMSIQ